jgi:hypothetical protein
MKTNKKAILGMLVAMILSLGMMNGINSKGKDLSLQQAGVVAAYYAPRCETESWKEVGRYTSGVCGAYTILYAAAGGPVGWSVAGVYLL